MARPRRFPPARVAPLLAALLGLTLPAPACGPFFPNALLFDADASLLWAPTADLRHEIDRIAPPGSDRFAAVGFDKNDGRSDRALKQSLDADVAEVHEALIAMELPDAQARNLVAAYAEARAAVRAVEENGRKPGPALGGPPAASPTIPREVPAEFADYLRALADYRAGRVEAARMAWAALLARPAAERRHRSVWAAYMLGRSYVGEDAKQAATWFGKAREMAAAGGFTDRLGLAAAGYGWEARARLDDGDARAAIGLYLKQHATGDPTAVNSLAAVCQGVFDRQKQHPEALRELAADPASARVVTAFVLARGGHFRRGAGAEAAKAWLAAVEAAGAGDVVGADRMAWSAYQLGDTATADRWVRRAPADAPVALWVRAKLLLRAGHPDAAAAVLAKACRAFPAGERWNADGGYDDDADGIRSVMGPARRVEGELGVLHLSRGQFVEAMDRLYRAGWWRDAAYVAERVLTADELVAYVDAHCPEGGAGATDRRGYGRRTVGNPDELRHLLARRLTRAGRWKEARKYFPAGHRPTLDAYVAAIRAGHDRDRSDEDRGRSLWEAATICRKHGMGLLGTEGAPDSAWTAGSYEGVDFAAHRQKYAKPNGAGATPAELQRAAAARPNPDKRFHYRYTAADHAWAAAELLPDESDETARALCTAGQWLADRDPKAADRFYRALIERCATTRLGREAAARKWLPAG